MFYIGLIAANNGHFVAEKMKWLREREEKESARQRRISSALHDAKSFAARALNKERPQSQRVQAKKHFYAACARLKAEDPSLLEELNGWKFLLEKGV